MIIYHSLDQADLSDFQEFSNMQHCPSSVLPTMEPPATCRVNVSQSPFLHAFYSHHPLRLTIDTGTETSISLPDRFAGQWSYPVNCCW